MTHHHDDDTGAATTAPDTDEDDAGDEAAADQWARDYLAASKSLDARRLLTPKMQPLAALHRFFQKRDGGGDMQAIGGFVRDSYVRAVFQGRVKPRQEACAMAEGECIQITTRARQAWAVLDPALTEQVCALCTNTRQTHELVDPDNPRRGTYSKPCRGGALERAAALYNDAAIPARYAGASFATWTPREDAPMLDTRCAAVAEVVRTLQPGAGGLWLYGSRGTGKTHLAAAALRHLTIERVADGRPPVPCQWVSVRSLFERLKRGLRHAGQGVDELIERLKSIPVLVLDGLASNVSAFEATVLSGIIAARYEGGHVSTLVTSVEGPAQMAAGMGEGEGPLAGAVAQLCEDAQRLSMRGVDYRMRG